MSPASRAVKRLRELYGSVFHRMREHEARLADPLAGRCYFRGIEQLEPRLLLSVAPTLPGLQLVDPDNTRIDGQVVVLDFDGADDVDYRGPVEVSDIDVPAFRASGVLAGQEQEIIGQTLNLVRTTFGGSGVLFTLDRPSEGAFSTIYIGGDGAAFSDFGEFPGLAEQVDVGNTNPSDNALVFSDGFFESDASALAERLAANISHEAGHLLGYAHEGDAPADGLHALAAESGRFVSVSPSTFTGGQATTVTVRVQNTGDSDDMIIECDSKPSGWTVSPTYWNPYMASGSYYNALFTVTPPVLGGSGTIVWKFYDDDITSNDLLATYNQSVSATAARPDLSASIDALSEPWRWGTAVSASLSVTNQGTAASGSFRIDLVASNDSTIGDADDQTITYWNTSLNPGATWSTTYNWTLPETPYSGMPSSGTVYYGIKAAVVTNETDTGDNNASDSVTMSPAEQGDIVSASPSSFTGGQATTVTVRVQNIGLSDDMIIECDSLPSGWSISPTYRNPYMNSGSYYDAQFTVTPPLLGGSGTIVWKFYDDDITSNDLLDTYNQSVSATAVRPDLSSSIDALSEPWRWGTAVSANLSVTNQGNAASGSFRVDLVASSNATIGDGDDQTINYWNTSLNAGATWSTTYNWTLPETPYSGMPSSGTVYYGIKAAVVTNETDTGDNNASDPVTMSPAEQGQIISASPSSFTGGQATTVTVRVQNIGLGDDMIVECDSKPSGWTVSPTNVNPYIASGAYYDAQFTVTAPTAGGSGTIVWKLYDDDIGIHPSGSDLLATYNQAVSAVPAQVVNWARWENAVGSAYADGADVEAGDVVYLAVDASGFSTGATFGAWIRETDGGDGDPFVHTTLSYDSSVGRWRTAWTAKWSDDGFPTYDPDYIFIVDTYGTHSQGTLDVKDTQGPTWGGGSLTVAPSGSNWVLDWPDATDYANPNGSGLQEYKLWIDDNSDFSSPVSGYNGVSTGAASSATVTLPTGYYYWKVVAEDNRDNPSSTKYGPAIASPFIQGFVVNELDGDGDGYASKLQFLVTVDGGAAGISNGVVEVSEDDWFFDDPIAPIPNVTVGAGQVQTFGITVNVAEHDKLWGDGIETWWPYSATQFEFIAKLKNAAGSVLDTVAVNKDTHLEILDGLYTEHLETPGDLVRADHLDEYFALMGGKPVLTFGGEIELDIDELIVAALGTAGTVVAPGAGTAVGAAAGVAILKSLCDAGPDVSANFSLITQIDIADLKGMSSDADFSDGDLTNDWITIWQTGGLGFSAGLSASVGLSIPFVNASITCGITPLVASSLDDDPVVWSVGVGNSAGIEGQLLNYQGDASVGVNGTLTPSGVDIHAEASAGIANIAEFDGDNPFHIGTSVLTPAEVSIGRDFEHSGTVTYEIRADVFYGVIGSVLYGLPAMTLDWLVGTPPVPGNSHGLGLAALMVDAISGSFAGDPFIRLPSTANPEVDVERSGTDNVHSHAFGQVTLGQSASQVFTVRNEGDAPLTVSQASGLGTPFSINPVNGSGTGDDWVVDAGSTRQFTVTYQPTASGGHNATLTLASNDDDEGSYQISFTGTGVAAAEIEVKQNTTLIADNSSVFDFGSVLEGSGGREFIFTINNVGDLNLTVGSVLLDNNNGFQVTQQPSSNVAGNGSTTFWIKMLADTPGPKSADVRFSNSDANGDENPFNFHIEGSVTDVLDAAVVARHVFYNNSPMDGSTPGASSQDDDAIAVGKQALMPGDTGSGANCTAYSKGLNGIMVDIDGLANPGGLNLSTIGDYFGFKVGTTNDPSGWASAPAPTAVDVRSVGGNSRVTIIWADNAIQKQWLQVTVKSGAATGLPDDEVFYFGNMPGDATGDGVTNGFDLLRVRQNYLLPPGGGRDDTADVTMDGNVNAFDLLAVRQNYLQSLPMISTPAAPTGMAMTLASFEETTEPLAVQPVTTQLAPVVEQVQVTAAPTAAGMAATISASFSRPGSVAPAALEMVSPVGLKVDLPAFRYEPVTRTASWTTTSLADGLYQGVIRSSSVLSDGASMARDSQFRFKLTRGIISEFQQDTNGDGIIDLLDLVAV